MRIVHQIDPEGLIPGGIPTFIGGLIKAAPPDIAFSVVGLTCDPRLRPVGRWALLERSGRQIPFFPVGRIRNAGRRGVIPLSIKMTAGVARYRSACSAGCDITEFHRFEPAIPFLGDPRPKNAFVHQNMAVIRNAQSDILWKYIPRLYFALERKILPHCASVYCVSESAVDAYREKFPAIADRFRFIATWMDPEVFHPVPPDRRSALRQGFREELGLSSDVEILIWVGRLDKQKDPLLLIEAFSRVTAAKPDIHLIIVGDGILKADIVERVNALGLQSRVIFAGLRNPRQVAELLQISNLFVMTSAYEGMPMALLEALGCGVPVVTTAVGEVHRVVRPGINGHVVASRAPEDIACAALDLVSRGEACRGVPCLDSVREYVPEKVLAPVYETYRSLAGRRRGQEQ